ncbi:hypothetical protein Q5H91_10870 [Sphingomonas sp. KR1UV-12]|uniref:Bacterial OB-fold domain-containing protein n=1 Tax=Sphingomonas aurea TaxID=3063994 RepID=A0ABT9EL70_9SPHN|nr:hypothetical protein [Sphingomonas sp. KR1UV-12]MDP1027717.1 hypothetical protein [Sphingomonas sp. KR1UV-12]
MSLPFNLTRRGTCAVAAAALFVVGGAGGALAGKAFGPTVEMAPMRPTAIRALTAGDDIVTIRGQVAEVFGNKFVASDGSGRALVDLGRAGEDKALVAPGQTVSVQGRFDRGMLRASFLVDATNKVLPLGPAGGPGEHRGPGGPGGPGRHGPDGPPPPPPPPADGAAPPPPPPAGGAAPVAPPAPVAAQPTQG